MSQSSLKRLDGLIDAFLVNTTCVAVPWGSTKVLAVKPFGELLQPSSAKPYPRYRDASNIGNQLSTGYQALEQSYPPCSEDSLSHRIKTPSLPSLILQELHTVEQSLFIYTHFFSSLLSHHFHLFDFSRYP
jgi:hypothetical protein